jgi:hypothetical protein
MGPGNRGNLRRRQRQTDGRHGRKKQKIGAQSHTSAPMAAYTLWQSTRAIVAVRDSVSSKPKESTMKSILLAACAVITFAAPALANDWTQNQMLEEMRQQRLQQSMQFQQQQLQDQMNANAAAVQQRQQQIYNQSMRMRGW